MNPAAPLTFTEIAELYGLLRLFLIPEEQQTAMLHLNKVRDQQVKDPAAAREALCEFAGLGSLSSPILRRCDQALTQAISRRQQEAARG